MKSKFLEELKTLLKEDYYMGHLLRAGEESITGGVGDGTDEIFIIPATCETPGREYFKCGACGRIHDVEIPAGHDYVDAFAYPEKKSVTGTSNLDTTGFYIKEKALEMEGQSPSSTDGNYAINDFMNNKTSEYTWFGCCQRGANIEQTWNIHIPSGSFFTNEYIMKLYRIDSKQTTDLDIKLNGTIVKNIGKYASCPSSVTLNLKEGDNLIGAYLAGAYNHYDWTYAIELLPVSIGKTCSRCGHILTEIGE